MRNMDENSLRAYDEIYDSLPKSRAEVFRIIYHNPLSTLEDICARLGKYPHQVSGRLTELKDAGYIKPDGTGTTRTGKVCHRYVCTSVVEQQNNIVQESLF